MTVADVVRAIRARWLLFTVCCIVPIAAAAFAAAHASAPVYSATAELFVGPTEAGRGRECLPERLFGDRACPAADPIVCIAGRQPRCLAGGDRRLAPGDNPVPALRQVSATSPLNSVLIDITASGGSAAAARDIANDTALRFAGLAERVSGSLLGHVLAGRSGVGPPVGPAWRPATQAVFGEARAAAHRAELLAQDQRSVPRACSRARCWADSGHPAGEDGPEGADRRPRPDRAPDAALSQVSETRGDGQDRSSAARGCRSARGPRLVGGRVVPQAPPRAGSRPGRLIRQEPGGNQLGAGRLRPRGRHQPCACPGGSRFLGATGGRRRARWPDRRSLRHGQPRSGSPP